MIEDDHYIANARNAHIDTAEFEQALRSRLSDNPGEVHETLERIYNIALSRTNIAPAEPDDDQLICRYLSPIKFLRFLENRHIDFPVASQFYDHWECRVPDDYEYAVLRVLRDLEISADAWSRLVRIKAGDWNVSCWTQLDDYFDDHLMWYAYAGGWQGVGLTVRYGVLKKVVKQAARQLDRDGSLWSGRVSYDTLSLLPFMKHYMFRNEKEIRFAFRAFQPGAQSVAVDEIFSCFGVRISPAATLQHCDMIRKLWIGYGGEDRVQWPQ